MNGLMLGSDLAHIKYCATCYRSSRERFLVHFVVWRGSRIVIGRAWHLCTLVPNSPKADLVILVSRPDEMGILFKLAVFSCLVVGTAKARKQVSLFIKKKSASYDLLNGGEETCFTKYDENLNEKGCACLMRTVCCCSRL